LAVPVGAAEIVPKSAQGAEIKEAEAGREFNKRQLGTDKPKDSQAVARRYSRWLGNFRGEKAANLEMVLCH
jgi:hypothetical protein